MAGERIGGKGLADGKESLRDCLSSFCSCLKRILLKNGMRSLPSKLLWMEGLFIGMGELRSAASSM